MSADGPRPIRGYRPSRMGASETEEDQGELVRLANVKLYAARAQAGLPLFDEPDDLRVAFFPGKRAMRIG